MTGSAEEPNKQFEGSNLAAEGVSVLDRALWLRFSDDREFSEFVHVWLALQVRQAENAVEAVIVLETEPGKGFGPVAIWPKGRSPSGDLTAAVDAALERDAGTISGAAVAQPLDLDGELIGAVGLGFSSTPVTDQPIALQNLRWGTGWLLSAMRRDLMRGAAQDKAKMSAVFDLFGAVIDAGGSASACLAAANLLARSLNCSQVGIGFKRRKDLKLNTLSDVADFRLNTAMTQAIERAMLEAVDQEGSILFPPPEDQAFVASIGHADLARIVGGGELLTVPLFADDQVVGAVHFQKPHGEVFARGEIMIAEASAAALGSLLLEKKRNDRNALRVVWDSGVAQLGRLLGPGYLKRKVIVGLLAAATVFFTFARADFRIVSEAEIQGQVVRSIVAPFDGYVFEEAARAGDVVHAGDLLARLDERDLRIELLRWKTDLGRYQAEYDKALAERNASAARIAAANVDQSRAKAELISRQLKRATLVAPFDAIVIEGDLSQSLGAAVRRGEKLFQLAPLDKYRVAVEVEEAHFDEIALAQTGNLILTSLPDQSFKIEVTQITPSLQSNDGRNFAVVEAQVESAGRGLRPGMRGVAKIDVEERLLIGIWTQPILDWIRLAIWRWTI